MKKLTLALGLFCASTLATFAQTFEYKIVTSIESIVPMGLGRSRIIEQDQAVDVAAYTTTRSDGKDSDQGRVDRSDLKIDRFKETKLLNFYSGVGINFQNIASNDALMSAKINEIITQGWELAFVVSGVESKGSRDDTEGIFITRYIFRKPVKAGR